MIVLPAWLRRNMGVALLLALCLVFVPLFSNPHLRDAPEAKMGAVSLAGLAGAQRPVWLEGEWRLDWLSPPSGSRRRPESLPAPVPGAWDGLRGENGAQLPSHGRAVYRLTIRDLPPGPYRLYVPAAPGAWAVSVDGAVKSRRGTIGDDAAATRYDWRAQDVMFEHRGGNVELAVETAAFLLRNNGLPRAPVLGTPEQMQAWVGRVWLQEALIQAALALIGLFGFAVFLFRRSDRASLCFAMAMLLIFPGAAIIGTENLLLAVWPGLGMGTMLGLIYCGAWSGIAFWFAYIREIFPEDAPPWAYRWTIAAFAISTLVQLAAALAFESYAAATASALVFSALTIPATLLMGLVVVRAVRARRTGAGPFLVASIVFPVMAIIVLASQGGLIPSDLLDGFNVAAFGVVTLVAAYLIVAAERSAQSIAATESSNEDLRSLLDMSSSVASEMQLAQLLGKIVEVASRIVNAERSSLFLYDAGKRELWSLVAQGDNVGEIRFPDDRGIAGAAFRGGETVNVPDAYADERFNPEVDRETGFTTRSILAMPVFARDGRKLGVMQALNRKGGGPFTEADAGRMAAFVAQASVSIDNATLFSEVVSSRNYNESILASMSSGVVTLDPQARVAKFNAAACRILKTTEERLEGLDARQALSVQNLDLLAELEAVRASGEPRQLLDVDLVTYGGGTISANISSVPLLSDGEDVGLLLLFEDISEGKRLQGAMRRFMPQQVVEQVLGREDDLLFGSSVPASVLFADIRNFTSMSEALSPRETVDMLNEIFTELFEAVAATDGILDKYIGDAVMAVYGAPFPGGDDAINAVTGAIQMIGMIDTINCRRRERGQPDLRLGAGIASGEVVAGTIGSPKRMDYTVIGDTVNLAARLQDATKTYRVNAIVCDGTAAKVGQAHRFRPLDLIRVRGRQKPTEIFEIVAAGTASPELCAAYAVGRAAVAARDWAAAYAAFEQASRIDPGDRPSLIMRERVRAAQVAPPPADWDGVW